MKKIWIFIIIVNIIILFTQTAFYIVKDVKIINNAKAKEESAMKEDTEVIVPKWYNHHAKMYDGQVDSKDIYKAIYKLVNITIPEIYNKTNNMDDKQIEEYYYANEEKINNEYLIENKEQFINISKNLKNNYKSGTKYESAEFNMIDYKEEGNYAKTELIIYYNDSISIKLKINTIIEKNDKEKEISFES